MVAAGFTGEKEFAQVTEKRGLSPESRSTNATPVPPTNGTNARAPARAARGIRRARSHLERMLVGLDRPVMQRAPGLTWDLSSGGTLWPTARDRDR